MTQLTQEWILIVYFWLWFNSATQWLKCQFSTCCPISGSVFIYLSIYVYIIIFVVVDKQKNTTPATTSPRNKNLNLLVRINFLNLFLHFYLNKNWNIY
jgi:hypothetical protein